MKKFVSLIITTVCITLIVFAFFHSDAVAIEVAPRISDREIVERLSHLEEGQKQLEERIEAMERQMNQRFDDMNQRFDDIKWFLGTMIGTLLVINTGVLGYVLKRQGKIEATLETQKDEIVFLKGLIEKLIPPKGI